MADHQLPAYLQNRQVQDFTDYASDGLGSALPPHVSIQGNDFTLIDAAGQEYQPMKIMDCVIVDRSNFACKMYYDKPWVPNADEPPVCWSTNGVGPSRDATIPQSRTCSECQFNVRGSATSKISGASIKACRDEYHMAILLPSIPDMMFRYVLTPGSFDNWQNYTAKFKNSNVKISMVVTRMGFQPKTNGVVTFESLSYIDEVTDRRVQQALMTKATDSFVGRLDTPKLIAPPQQGQIAPPNSTGQAPLLTTQPGSTMQVQQPGPFAPTPAPNVAANGPFQQNPAPTAATTSPSEPAPTTRRRRRTAAEMAVANGAQQPAPAPTTPLQAPFPVSQTPGALPGQLDAFPTPSGAPAQSQFGIAQPAPANPEVSAMLDDFFKG